MLFKLWIFEFDLSSLLAFIVGIFAGCTLLALIYSIMVVSSIKSKKYINKAQVLDVSDEEIKEIIENATKAFSDKKIKGAKGSISHCSKVSTNLVSDIARKFYPNSKRPIAELTIDEILQLAIYVSKRIDELLDRPGLRLVKKLKLSSILALGDAKKVVEASSLMRLTKKYKVKKVFSAIKGALNIVNPIYWARRIFINTAIDVAVAKLCLTVIKIVGEETYKIYSKRVFEEERSIDTNVEDDIDMIENDLVDVSDEEIEEYLLTQGLEEKIERKRRK